MINTKNSKIECSGSNESYKNLQKKQNHRQSSALMGRSSLIIRSSFMFDQNEKKKLEIFTNEKQIFEWEAFKKNPCATFFDDPANIELITKQQLLEVLFIFNENLIISIKVDYDFVEKTSNEPEN